MITIYDIEGNGKYSTPINEGSTWVYELMKENNITLKFSILNPVIFNLGDWCDTDFGRFELVDMYRPAYNVQTGGYDYELRLDVEYWKWKNKIFKYRPEVGGQEASWSLTASLSVHLGVFLDNLKAHGYKCRKITDYVVDIDVTVTSEMKFINYDNVNLIDALTLIAETFGCEWWITDNVIHFGKCEHGEAVNFEDGVNIEKMTSSNSKTTFATRLYVFGGTTNIPARYRKKLVFNVTDIQPYLYDNVTDGIFIEDATKKIYEEYISGAGMGIPRTERKSTIDYDKDFSSDETAVYQVYETVFPNSKNIITFSGVHVTLTIPHNYSPTWPDVNDEYDIHAEIKIGDKTYQCPNVKSKRGAINVPLIDSVAFEGKGYDSNVLVSISVHVSYDGQKTNISSHLHVSGMRVNAEYAKKVDITFIAGANQGKSYVGWLNVVTNKILIERMSNTSPFNTSSFAIGDKYTITNAILAKVPAYYFSDDTDSETTVSAITEQRLMLPETWNNGHNWIDAWENLREEEIVESVVKLDDIWPKPTLTITDVVSYRTEIMDSETNKGTGMYKTYYLISCNTFDFREEYQMPNEDLYVTFLSGLLSGMEFRVEFRKAGTRINNVMLEDGSIDSLILEESAFEISTNENYGVELPNTVMYPSEADTFSLRGWDVSYMPDLALVSTAEEELLQKGLELMAKAKIDPNTYTCPAYWHYTKDHDLAVGQRVNLINKAYFSAPDYKRESRIIRVEKKLDITYDNTIYTVGETAEYSRIGAIEDKLNSMSGNESKSAGKNGGIGQYGSFLHSDREDATNYLISFYKGIRIGEALLTFDDTNKALRIDTDVYSEKGVSALGMSPGGTGGGTGGSAYDRYDGPWGTAPTDGSVLSAALGVDLNTRLSAVETGKKGHVISVTGTGNVITGVSESADGTTLTFTKGTIDLSGYATLAALNAHIDNTTVHITAAERTKWNKVVADFTAITGTDSDTIINKWEEVVAFLDTYTEADTLAGLLGNKADKTVKISAGTGLTGGGDLSANRTLSLAASGVTAGTYTKVTVDAYGRVTTGTTLSANDIPALSINKITGLQAALDSKLNKTDFASYFATEIEKWFVRDLVNKGIYPADYDGDAVGFYSKTFVSALGLSNTGGGGSTGGGASALYELIDVLANSTGDGVQGAAAGSLLSYDGTHWKAVAQSSIVPDLTGYATESWVTGQGFATVSAMNAVLAGKVDKVSGKGLSTNDFTTALLNKLNGIEAGANKYVLPTASASVLGGIKVGSRLAIDANGVLSATYTYTLPTASGTVKGGVKVGDTLAIASDVLNLKSGIVTAGTYTKVTVDTYGRVTAGAALAATDIPALDWSKITSGKPTTLAGYGITDAYTKTDADGRYVKKSGDTMTGNLSFSNSGTALRGIQGTMGDNDQWRVMGGATGANGGYLEIATSDDGTEPIYVRQYKSGIFSKIVRTLTLLDGSGNSSLPGSLTVNGATALKSTLSVTGAATLNSTLDVTDSVRLHQGLELYFTTPYIDFHFNNSTADYTSRIIEQASGVLTMSANVTIPSSKVLRIGDCTISWDATNNALKFDKDIYSEKGVSALGMSNTGGSGGGSASYDRLDAWADYTSDKAEYVLSAGLGYGLYTSLNSAVSRIASLEGGAAVSVTTTGSGNAITAISKSGTTITATKGATFLTSHQALDHINFLGTASPISGTNKFTNGLRLYGVYNNGYPCSYGNLLRIGGGGQGELLAQWTSNKSVGRLYYRSIRDNADAWTDWRTVAYTSDMSISGGVITINGTSITPLTAHQAVSNKGATLAWGSAVTIATVGSTNITATLPSNPNTDTKNTAGSTDTSSKIFLIGATSQAANPQTYSHDTAFVGTDGCLYSGGAKVLTAHQSLANYVTLSTAQTVSGQKTFSKPILHPSTQTWLNGMKEGSVVNFPTAGCDSLVHWRTKNGHVSIGCHASAGDSLTFGYMTAAIVDAGTNTLSNSIVFDMPNAGITAGKFVKSGGTSSQFLKADGSVDGNSYLTTGTASSTYVKKSGDTMTGALLIKTTVTNNYNEGVRVCANNNWSSLMLLGSDNSAATGTSAKSWGLFNYNGDFYLSKNGSNLSSGNVLSNISGVWRANGNTLWHAGNDGSGSGLDADLLDGVHASKFPYINNGTWRVYGNGAVAGLADNTAGLSAWAFGETRNTGRTYLGILKPSTPTCGINAHGTIAVFGQGDTHMGLAVDNDSANFQVFGGNLDKIVWRKKVAFTDSSISGNAASATKLATARTINGTSFNGTANITTASWGTARNIGIVNSDGTGTAVTVSVNGSGNVNLKLPATIKAALNGNADTATALTSSAGSATLPVYFSGGKPVACTASSLFSALSSSATTNLSVTVGGQNRTIANLYARYLANNFTSRQASMNVCYGDGTLRHFIASSSTTTGKPEVDAHILHMSWDNNGGYDGQLAIPTNHSGHIQWRNMSGKDASGNYVYNSWKTLANLTDNVASATKLQTARTIWGQSFNGTANVSGLLTATTGSSHSGIKLGDAYLTAITGQVIFQNLNTIRFGSSDNWAYNDWAGIRYDTGNKHLYMGFPTGSPFINNGTASTGQMTLPGVTQLNVTSGGVQTKYLFLNTGDATLKVYDGRITDVKSDGNICMQTSIDATDGQSHAYPTQYSSRCNLVLQPRGGQVYIGENPDGGNAYKLNVNGDILAKGWLRTQGNFGWYSQTHGGGWYMNETTWIRNWGNKGLYMNTATIRTDGDLQVGNNGEKFHVTSAGAVTAAGEVISKNPNAFRLAYGNYGVILRNDGTNFYALLTASGSAVSGSWNSLRPLTISLGTGKVMMDNGAQITGTLEANCNIIMPTGRTIRIGDGVLEWDNANNSFKVSKYGGGTANFYATGGISALGLTPMGTGSASVEELNMNYGTITNCQFINGDGDIISIGNTDNTSWVQIVEDMQGWDTESKLNTWRIYREGDAHFKEVEVSGAILKCENNILYVTISGKKYRVNLTVV